MNEIETLQKAHRELDKCLVSQAPLLRQMMVKKVLQVLKLIEQYSQLELNLSSSQFMLNLPSSQLVLNLQFMLSPSELTVLNLQFMLSPSELTVPNLPFELNFLSERLVLDLPSERRELTVLNLPSSQLVLGLPSSQLVLGLPSEKERVALFGLLQHAKAVQRYKEVSRSLRDEHLPLLKCSAHCK